MQGQAMMPTANFLYIINESAENLEEVRTQEFHTLMAKLIFLCKCACLDI